MNAGLKKTGAPTMGELKASRLFPSDDVIKKGPVVVIECIEEIPCNPCETACPRGAISIGTPIINIPAVEFSKCTGCGICIATCPGLAIYVKDYTYSENTATISFPFEYLPLPQEMDTVKVTGRNGEDLCDGTVLKVINNKKNDRTSVITVEFPKEYFEDAVMIRRINI